MVAGSVPSEAVREASPPASGGLLGFFSVPCLEQASTPSLPASSHGILLSASAYVFRFPLLIKTTVMLD